MASNINPNNIDTAYPVAGQDNDSQGFRDNFTNIKSNFEFAENEIEDLQSKVILKSALTGTSLDNDMSGAIISAATLKDPRESVDTLGTITGTATVNVADAPYQTVTTSGSITLAFNGWPSSGHSKVRVAITIANTSHTVTLPVAVDRGLEAIRGLENQIITFGSAGTYEFEFSTINGGSSIAIQDLNRSTFSANSIEQDPVESGDSTIPDVNLSYLGTWVTTSGGPGELNLGAGYEGQLKSFALTADNGDCVINIASAGWNAGSSGTVTLNDIGDGCILQYMNSSWFVVGNNGCTIA